MISLRSEKHLGKLIVFKKLMSRKKKRMVVKAFVKGVLVGKGSTKRRALLRAKVLLRKRLK